MNATKQIDQCVSSFLEISANYLGKEFSKSFSSEYETKKSETLLQIMLFGSYNAGKSSLINALSASEVAPTGDIPKTATADRYEWNGCYLLDTPGVNAPIEHEELTSEQVDRSELILFVIRQGDQDAKDVYDRMFTMLEKGKHVFIVYNHELVADELPLALTRLNDIMINYSERYDVVLQRVCEIPVIPINIKTAMKGRYGKKEALVEHSGLAVFESVFQSWFRQFDSEHHYLDRLKKYIHQCLVEPLLASVDSKITNDVGVGSLKDLQRQREQLVKFYNLLNVRVANHIRSEVISIKPQIAEAMESGSSQVGLEATLNQLASKVAESTSKFIQQYCDDADVNIDAVLENSVEILKSTDKSSAVGNAIEGVLVSGAKNVDSDMITQGFLALRKLKVPGIKGRWASTLGGWAGKANIALTVVTGLYEIYSASAQQDKLNAEQRKQSVGLHQAVEGAANIVSSAILEESRNAVKTIEADVLGGLDMRIDLLIEDQNLDLKNLENVKFISNKLGSVII